MRSNRFATAASAPVAAKVIVQLFHARTLQPVRFGELRPGGRRLPDGAVAMRAGAPTLRSHSCCIDHGTVLDRAVASCAVLHQGRSP